MFCHFEQTIKTPREGALPPDPVLPPDMSIKKRGAHHHGLDGGFPAYPACGADPGHAAAGAGGPPVDLSLAQTYIPAFFCTLRGALLILLVSRDWSSASVPVLTAAAIVLAVDRVVRTESIFDSNALLATMLATHWINAFRADPHTHYFYFGSSEGGRGDERAHALTAAGNAAQGVYCLLSVAMAGGFDAVGYVLGGTGSLPGGMGRPGTVVVHGFLLLCVLQTPLAPEAVKLQGILTRNLGFMGLSLTWSYVVGVPQMVHLLSTTTRPPLLAMSWSKGGRKGRVLSTIVQSFTPCHLRYLCVLLCSQWAVLPVLVVMCALTTRDFIRLNTQNAAAVPGTSHGGHGDDSGGGDEQRQQQQQVAVVVHPEYCTTPGGAAGPCSGLDAGDGTARAAVSQVAPIFVTHTQVDDRDEPVGDFSRVQIKATGLFTEIPSTAAAQQEAIDVAPGPACAVKDFDDPPAFPSTTRSGLLPSSHPPPSALAGSDTPAVAGGISGDAHTSGGEFGGEDADLALFRRALALKTGPSG